MGTDSYVEELENNVGKDGWAKAFAKVAILSREQVNDIATYFVAKTAKSNSKTSSQRRTA